jgi:hypothetical protein
LSSIAVGCRARPTFGADASAKQRDNAIALCDLLWNRASHGQTGQG